MGAFTLWPLPRVPPCSVPEQPIILTQDDEGAFDLVCRDCGGSSRVHPDETFVDQVRLFCDAHRHPAPSFR